MFEKCATLDCGGYDENVDFQNIRNFPNGSNIQKQIEDVIMIHHDHLTLHYKNNCYAWSLDCGA